MITEINGHRIQTTESGMILKWEENYSYEVALGEGMPEWAEIIDEGQLTGGIVDVKAEIIN